MYTNRPIRIQPASYKSQAAQCLGKAIILGFHQIRHIVYIYQYKLLFRLPNVYMQKEKIAPHQLHALKRTKKQELLFPIDTMQENGKYMQVVHLSVRQHGLKSSQRPAHDQSGRPSCNRR
jgi:hypothetical protein